MRKHYNYLQSTSNQELFSKGIKMSRSEACFFRSMICENEGAERKGLEVSFETAN
jgi:hypothetical protein